jgi:N-acetylmuramoyl-L-alanine amidase
VRCCIDPGHGGSDPGAVGHGLHEADITLQVARLLKKELTAAGHEVLMTRGKDKYVSLGQRAMMANAWNADLFVSLHCNAAATASAMGLEIFHFNDSDDGRHVASRVWDRLDLEFGDHHLMRGVKEANFAVLRLTSMPAVLVEMEFITNLKQSQNLADPAWQLRMAKALAEGIGA